MKTSSCGLEAFTRLSDALSTLCRFSRMLPLLSMIIPSEIGTSSRRKILIGCSTPFSKTLNAFCCRSVTSFPLWSKTLTGNTTSRVSTLKVGSSDEGDGWGDGFCAQTNQEEAKQQEKARLLRRRIIPEAEKRFERRQTPRLHQLDANMPILAIPSLVAGGVVKHVLIAKLDPNFCGDVGKLVQILHVVAA